MPARGISSSCTKYDCLSVVSSPCRMSVVRGGILAGMGMGSPSMLRIIEGDPIPIPAKIPPRTTLMRQGLDTTDKQSYLVHEEEIPRAGITVTESFRRTRWTKGEAYVWLAVQKQ